MYLSNCCLTKVSTLEEASASAVELFVQKILTCNIWVRFGHQFPLWKFMIGSKTRLFCKRLCDDEAESSTRVLDQIKTLNNMICCAFGNVYHSWSGISEKWSLEETKKCHASPDGVLE